MKHLDPSNPLNKKDIKASITDAITKEVVGSDRDEVAWRVESEYEKLLAEAHVFTHIPSLTAGKVRRDVVANNMRHGARTKPDLILDETSLNTALTP